MAGEKPKTTAAGLKAFKCPSCGAGVLLRALGHSVSVACRACGSVIDATDENYRIILQERQKEVITPLIQLGQRGKLHGVTWEVIGFMVRSDETGIYQWGEYLLFNPKKKFHWLTEFNGHWNYVVMTHDRPHLHGDRVNLLGKWYSLFHRGKARVVYVLGEFYWRVKVGDQVEVADYINPPEILSVEKDENELVWSLGEYVDAETVRQAFQITQPMPVQQGVAPNQPSAISSELPEILKRAAVFLTVIVGLQLLFVVTAKNEQVFQRSFSYMHNDPDKTKVSEPFELKHGTTNLAFHLQSPVMNNWLELETTLVNDQNGAVEEFEQGVEYYYGYDSDGQWTDGSQNSRVTLQGVPEGRYHLLLRAANGMETQFGRSGEMSYTLTVKRDVPTWSNFWLAIFLLSVGPAFYWWSGRSFEVSRWSTSDYSPYDSGEE